MKQFLTDIAISAVLFVILFVANGLAMNHIPIKNNYTFKRDYMEKNANGIKTLVAGHSLFEWGLNPHELGDSAFTLAMCGRVIHYDEKLLERYIPRMKNLQTVLLPMHYTFSGFNGFYSSDSVRGVYVYHYHKDMGIDYPEYFRHYIPYHYRTLFDDGCDRKVDSLGYGMLTEVFDGKTSWEEMQSGQAQFCASLGRIAQLCHEHGVRLVVLTPPCADAYQQYVTEEGLSNMQSVINTVREKHPIEYYNYMCDSQFRSDSLYANATHLNHTGATLFARRVKSDLGL